MKTIQDLKNEIRQNCTIECKNYDNGGIDKTREYIVRDVSGQEFVKLTRTSGYFSNIPGKIYRYKLAIYGTVLDNYNETTATDKYLEEIYTFLHRCYLLKTAPDKILPALKEIRELKSQILSAYNTKQK